MNTEVKMQDANENVLMQKASKGLKISLMVKVTAIIAITIALVAAVTNLIIFNLSLKALKDEIRNNLVLLASNAAATINSDTLATIKSPEDEGNANYMKLQKRLQDIQAAGKDENGKPKLRYIYTLAKQGDKYIYIIDAAPIEDKENHSSVGDEFDVGKYPKAIEAFSKPVAESDPNPDDQFGGLIQTGYAPIKDKNGSVIGVLAMDMDVSVIKEKEASLNEARVIAFLIAFILAIVLGIVFSRYLTNPIISLTKNTKKIAEGNFDVSVNLKRNDELGLLAQSFNAMAQDLKISHEALRKYNQELEEKVAQRTAALTQINKEIKDILDNMSQAIFTIDENLTFNDQHSRFAKEIFGDIKFADKSLLDVFFSEDSKQSDRANMELWLRRILENTDTKWENLEALQPIREIRIKTCDERGKEAVKYIQMDFQPITDIFEPDFKEKVTKIMVIVQDITEKKSLALEMERKEKEYKDNINQIVEIIKADQELFEDFVQECKDQLSGFDPKLIQLKDDKGNSTLINDLFRIMHTIKGNAKIFNLERIAGEAHSIENIFSAIRKGEMVMTDELLDETFIKLDRFNSLFNETLDIYNKIVSGKNADMGKTRTDERKLIDHEVIKVRVHDFNRLSELIKKADRIVGEEIKGVLEKDMGKEKAQAIETLLKETQQQLEALRKISLSRLFTRFPRMVRDISIELGKKVKLITRGEEIEVDKNIFDKIGDPLVHIIRNSLDHGIEKPEERSSAGKPEEGVIEINTSITNSELLVEIRDDGKGLDIDRIKAKAVKKGLITAESALEMKDEEAINLIFQPGFSTNEKVTDVSGRGVGMDVVKTSVEKELNGHITLETKKYQGLRIVLRIPLMA